MILRFRAKRIAVVGSLAVALAAVSLVVSIVVGPLAGTREAVSPAAEAFSVRGAQKVKMAYADWVKQQETQPPNQRTGWSGDGAPGDGTLRDFATGAVTQHFPKTLNRVDGEDFRLPTDPELDAMEAFQLTLGRQEDLVLPLLLKDPQVKRGQGSSSRAPAQGAGAATPAMPTRAPTPGSGAGAIATSTPALKTSGTGRRC